MTLLYYSYYFFYCTDLVTELFCCPPSFLPAFPPSFPICLLSTGQKREVEVMYGYSLLCFAKKINLSDLLPVAGILDPELSITMAIVP